MDTVFEALLFTAIGLLGISITLYVFAVSLLGRAIKISLQEKAEVEKQGKKDREDKIREIQNQLGNTTGSANLDIENLKKILEGLQKQKKANNRKSWWIITKPALLKVNGGGLLPGIFFVVSIIITTISRYFLDDNPNYNVTALLSGAVFFMVVGLVITYLILKVVEGVAVTSDEASLVREVEALKTAMIEIDDSKKTEMSLKFIDSEPPFHIKSSSEMIISCDLAITKGHTAKNPEVCFWVPNSFSILTKSEPIISHRKELENFVPYYMPLSDFVRPSGMNVGFSIKAPPTIGTYHCFYRYNCEGFFTDKIGFEIIVE
jgi:hypothetical protein